MQQQLHDADNHQQVSKDGILILFNLVRVGGFGEIQDMSWLARCQYFRAPSWVVHYCTLSMTECRVGTPYMRRNFIDGPPKASVDQSGPSFLQKLHLGYVPGPQKILGDHSIFC